jgi:ATP-dependent Clp protease protease subunit
MTVFKATMSAESDALELTLYGPIGANMFGEGITPQMVDKSLKANPNAKNVVVHISSPGGNVWDGMAIRNMLAQHPGKVHVEVEGIAASVATVIATAGDHVRMHEGSTWMMHEAHTQTQGSSREHKKALERLEAINESAAALYAQKSGKSKDDIRALMQVETWMTPEQAVEHGFANEVVKGKGGKKKAAPVMAFDLTPWGYEHVPQDVADAMKSAPTASTNVSYVTNTANLPPTDLAAVTHTNVTYTKSGYVLPAEPPAATHKETPKMTANYARIAMALGLNTDTDEMSVFNAVQTLTQTASRREHVLLQLRQMTNSVNDEAMLGAVLGLQQAAVQVEQLQEQMQLVAAHAENVERDAMIAADAADPKGRKLTPALATYFADKSPEELKAFLAVAPHVVQMQEPANEQGRQPMQGQQQPGQAQHNGKGWAEMSAREKHNLFVDNPEAYNALRASHLGN